jgi:hypothetical protein
VSERVLAGIASVPERSASLELAVASLGPQVDRLAISLNGYDDVPAFLSGYPHALVFVRGGGNGGDAEKFAAVDDWDGIVVTCDDDLIYPADYVKRIRSGLDLYGPGVIVGFHGGKTLGWNGAHKAATHKAIRCLDDLGADDTDVNVLGTGVIGFRPSEVPLWRDVFRSPNMADVHLACHAHRFEIPMVALEHRAGWLRDVQPVGTPSIYESNRAADGSERDTRVARKAALDSIDWSEPARRPQVHVAIATCGRPHLLPILLDDLEREGRYVDLEVTVYEDPSDCDYGAALQIVDDNGWAWHRFDERLGRKRHGQLVARELADCRDSAAGWFVFLPDDVRLSRHAIPRAIETWRHLDDPATLTLWRLRDHEGSMNWTGKFPRDRGEAWEVFHVDGIYMCRQDALEVFDYTLPDKLPGGPMSSGVGRWMSLQLHNAGRRMYRVQRSLATPVLGEPSMMNPDASDRSYPGMVAA